MREPSSLVALDGRSPPAFDLVASPGAPAHLVQFYDDDRALADAVARFVAVGLDAGEPVVLIATESHRDAFTVRLRAAGVDLDDALASGLLVLLDARETLGKFMVDQLPEWSRFQAVVGGALERARAQHDSTSVRAFGELVDILWREGYRQAAVLLEEMWNALGKAQSFSILCAYVMGSFYKSSDREAFHQICSAHSHVLPSARQALESELAHQRELERALRETVSARVRAEERLNRLFQQAPIAILLLSGPEHRFELVNPAYARLAGREASELQGMSAIEGLSVWPGGDVSALLSLFDRVFASGEACEASELPGAGGGFYNCTVEPMRDENGMISGLMVVAADVSDQVQARRDAEASLVLQRRTDELRELVLGMVSHDLRTPLSAISIGASLMLKRGELSDADAKVAARIARSADRMTHMVNQLLDFTRARLRGGITIDPKICDLAIICNEVISELQMTHPARSLRFESEGSVLGNWDRERLAEIVSNLIGNALRHGSADGPVEMRLRDEDGWALLEVHNVGAPIPPDQMPLLFEPFRRANERTRTISLGLGLYITREIVRAHGGRITATSGEATGTTFTVTLPRR
jgi:PAS domain S-box-containing protein